MQVSYLKTRLSRRGLLGAVSALQALGQPPHLQYSQRKGGYSEGIRTKWATGEAGLALVAAMVDHSDPDAQLPSSYRALFYLPAEADVYLAIREVEPVYFYWLEPEAALRRAWKAGRIQFQWNTQEVIKELDYRRTKLRLDSLGAVARLHAPSAGKADKLDEVLPVVLYHSRPPSRAESYRFVFRPEFKSKLTYRLLRKGSDRVLQKQEFEIALGDRPNEFLADLRGQPDGVYRIVASGHAIRDNAPVYKEVRFHHRLNLASS